MHDDKLFDPDQAVLYIDTRMDILVFMDPCLHGYFDDDIRGSAQDIRERARNSRESMDNLTRISMVPVPRTLAPCVSATD